MQEVTMKRRYLSLGVMMCTLLWALPAASHHSHSNYDQLKWTEMEGTVSRVVWIVPHAFLFLQVKDAEGRAAVWTLEGGSPAGIERRGVKRVDLQPGDAVKVRCNLLKDGSKGCLLGFVTPLHGDAARGHGKEVEWD
jgi:hypothetical protein